MRYPKFQEAIKSYAQQLPTATYWRYTNGMLPTFGRLITQYPELADALAADAHALAERQKSTPAAAPAAPGEEE